MYVFGGSVLIIKSATTQLEYFNNTKKRQNRDEHNANLTGWSYLRIGFLSMHRKYNLGSVTRQITYKAKMKG